MPDLYLEAMMHSLDHIKKDKFDTAIEQDIIKYVDSLKIEDDYSGLQLVTARTKRARLIEELKADIKMPELGKFLDDAFKFIKSDGLRYLELPKFQSLNMELHRAHAILEKWDPFKEITVNLRSLLEISDEAADAIYEIAKGAFKEERYENCLSVLVLLTSLDQSNSDYFFRLGIAAQRSGNIELAQRVYAECIDLDSSKIGARLFLAECYLIQGNEENAMREIAEVKKIEKTDLDPIWLDLLVNMEKKEELKGG